MLFFLSFSIYLLLLLKGNAENDEERPCYISGGEKGRQGEVGEGGYLSLDFAF